MIDRLGRVIFESHTDDSLSKIKAIVNKIKDHVKRTAKPPTGNQNCLLCTWCTEAHMRGFDVLPRPVYSPRDPIFNIKGESIVKNPIRQSLGSGLRSDIENLLDLTEIEGGRWYCHVNWNGSEGGHEFIIMRMNSVLYVVDSQQGIVADVQSKRGSEYFRDINWGNSYIVRMDNGVFDEEMFMKNNDPSQTLPWDEDLDIPYMRDNGMLPDEDINEAKVERVNDEGDEVPEKCDKCGSHVGLYLKGEPVWLCSNKKCGKYFGTAPCNFQESTYFMNPKTMEIINSRRTPPDVKAEGESWFEIDELAVPLVRACNNKGYVTRYCCSGHIQSRSIVDGKVYDDSDSIPEPYVVIDKTHDFKNLPNGWYVDDSGHMRYECTILRYRSKRITKSNQINATQYLGRYTEILNAMRSLCKYFDKLPNNGVVQEGVYSESVNISKMEKLYYWSPIRLAPDPDQGDIITIEHESSKLFVTDKIGLCPFYTLYDSEIFENIIKKYNADIVPVLPRDLDELSKEENITVKLRSSEAKPRSGDFTLYVYEVDKSSITLGSRSNVVHDKKYKSEYLYAIPRQNGNVIISAKPVKISHVHYSIEPESRNFQEGAFNDLKNGVNPYSTKRVFHISREGHLDGQVFKPRVPEYLDKYDPNYPNFEDVDNPRVCFSPSIEGCLNAMVVKVERWKADRFDKLYVYVPEKPLNQYKHTTNKQLIKDKKVYDANLTREIWIEEPVRLKMYGVIKVDQISNAKNKSTVPMLNGKSGERFYYSYKWHWLVKPKVLDKLPYDYSPTSVCEDMVRDLKRYNYGIPVNGKIQDIPSTEYYNKHYKLLSPDEFEKYGGGICWDYVEFMEGYLDAYGYSCKKYYIYTDTKDGDTHTFVTVDDGKGGLLYPESSFKLLEGLHKVKNVEEAIKMITSKMFNINDNSKKYSEIKYYVWEYTGHPPYGSNCKQCTEYFSKGEPFYEGTAINPNKQKIVKESVRMGYPDRFGNNTMTQCPSRMTTDDMVVQEGMFDAGFGNLRIKIAKALDGRFKVTNVFKAMGGKDKFDIVSEDSNDGIKTSVESTGNGCKVVSRGMGKMKNHFNNISLSAAFDRIISLFERPEVLLEGAIPCSFSAFMEADENTDENDDDINLDTFGSDNDGASPNNQYDEEEVSRLNELISDENHAVGQYFEAAKTTNNEVLRRLFSDIGNEERFHTEQLLYAKSTITGEKYEPMDKAVKKEYEELLEMGMDEETALNTAIDKQHLNDEDDGDDSDMEELEVDTKTLGESFQYYTDCLELCEIITESDLFESGSEALRHSMIVMESVLYMEEVGTVDQQKSFLKNNPITFLIKGFFSFIKFITGLVDKIKLFIRKVQTKQRRMHDWIKRNGIKQLFADGINMYFYDDRDLNHVDSSALLYCDMLCRIVELIAKDMGLNFQSRHKINDTSKTVQFNNVDDGLRRFREVVFSKTKIVVNENNEQKLAELFFGYSQGKLPTGKSVNIYHTLDMVANEIKKASQEVNNFITSIGALDKDLNSVYYKDPKRYRLGVDRLNKVYKGLTIIGKALASDMNEVLKLNNGLLEKTRAADAADMGVNPNNNH